jgi:ketosteroid isomerase-like protein
MLRLWLAMGVGVATLMVSGVVASMARAQPGLEPAAIVTAYEMARNRHDLDAAVAYFADDAAIHQRSTVFAGKDEIRKFLDGTSARARFVVISDRHVSGNRVMWTERTNTNTQGALGREQAQAQGPNGIPVGSGSAFVVSVEALVQDGKIHSLAYVYAGQPLRTDPALEGRAQLPASVGLGAVMVVLLGVVMVASVGLSRRRGSASSLRGRLMQDLQGWSAARQ